MPDAGRGGEADSALQACRVDPPSRMTSQLSRRSAQQPRQAHQCGTRPVQGGPYTALQRLFVQLIVLRAGSAGTDHAGLVARIV